MDDIYRLEEDIVHLVRLGVSGRPREVVAYAKRVARRQRRTDPERADALLAAIVTAAEPRSSAEAPFRRGLPPPALESSPSALVEVRSIPGAVIALPSGLREQLDQILLEWRSGEALAAEGLAPASTMAFTGPPGVGKTMSAHWLAHELGRPLYVLDLATVVGSRFGETGARLQAALAFAREHPCVLLLDEFDAVAARRSSGDDIGEMRRIVTVLLQEIDRWEGESPLIAATNHPELIDPAVWRRFEERLEFPASDAETACAAVRTALGQHLVDERYVELLGTLYAERPFSDITTMAARARKRAVLNDLPLTQVIEDMVSAPPKTLDRAARQRLARSMLELGFSQRKVREVTGFARDTLRKLFTDEVSVHG